MALYEKVDSMVYSAMFDLLESQGQKLEIPWQDAAITHSHVEMEEDYHGFSHKSAKDITWSWFYPSHYWFID